MNSTEVPQVRRSKRWSRKFCISDSPDRPEFKKLRAIGYDEHNLIVRLGQKEHLDTENAINVVKIEKLDVTHAAIKLEKPSKSTKRSKAIRRFSPKHPNFYKSDTLSVKNLDEQDSEDEPSQWMTIQSKMKVSSTESNLEEKAFMHLWNREASLIHNSNIKKVIESLLLGMAEILENKLFTHFLTHLQLMAKLRLLSLEDYGNYVLRFKEMFKNDEEKQLIVDSMLTLKNHLSLKQNLPHRTSGKKRGRPGCLERRRKLKTIDENDNHSPEQIEIKKESL